jgi:predicted NBD/HSP70 family sugar kinase
MKYYIGADLGTSALKLLLVDTSGSILKEVSKEYEVYFPKPAWSEQNPKDWWDAFVSGVKELTSDVDPSDIGGIGIADRYSDIVDCWNSLKNNFGGVFGGKVYEDFDPDVLFEKLNITIDPVKFRYCRLIEKALS